MLRLRDSRLSSHLPVSPIATSTANDQLFSGADQIEEAPPGDLGDETALVRRQALVHDFFRQLLCLWGCFAPVTGIERWVGIVFDGQLNRFGPLATDDLAGAPRR